MTGIAAVLVGTVLVSACAAPPPAPSAAASIAPSPAAADPWREDLDQLDREVRAFHPDPFKINPVSAWVAKLAETRKTIWSASPDEQLVQLASLVGLLDTHSGIGPPGPLHAYDVLSYPFSDGWFVSRARRRRLIGSRLVGSGARPWRRSSDAAAARACRQRERRARWLQGLLSYVEFLHGAGFVSDPAKPAYVVKGRTVEMTVDPPPSKARPGKKELGIVGDLMGEAPEAVARRTEPVWTRLDKKRS